MSLNPNISPVLNGIKKINEAFHQVSKQVGKNTFRTGAPLETSIRKWSEPSTIIGTAATGGDVTGLRTLTRRAVLMAGRSSAERAWICQLADEKLSPLKLNIDRVGANGHELETFSFGGLPCKTISIELVGFFCYGSRHGHKRRRKIWTPSLPTEGLP